jgi:NAD kinase
MRKAGIWKEIKRVAVITKSRDGLTPYGFDPTLSHDMRSESLSEVSESHYTLGKLLTKKFADGFPGISVTNQTLFDFLLMNPRSCPDDTLLVTFGGDGTYLQAAQKITNKSSKILGINSNIESSVGKLCGYGVDPQSEFEPQIDSLITRLQNERYETKQRTRIGIKSTKNPGNTFPLGTSKV